jgi:hypothetical protein
MPPNSVIPVLLIGPANNGIYFRDSKYQLGALNHQDVRCSKHACLACKLMALVSCNRIMSMARGVTSDAISFRS